MRYTKLLEVANFMCGLDFEKGFVSVQKRVNKAGPKSLSLKTLLTSNKACPWLACENLGFGECSHPSLSDKGGLLYLHCVNTGFILDTCFPSWSLQFCPTMQVEDAWVTIPLVSHNKNFGCWVSNGFLWAGRLHTCYCFSHYWRKERTHTQVPPTPIGGISKPGHAFLQCLPHVTQLCNWTMSL